MKHVVAGLAALLALGAAARGQSFEEEGAAAASPSVPAVTALPSVVAPLSAPPLTAAPALAPAASPENLRFSPAAAPAAVPAPPAMPAPAAPTAAKASAAAVSASGAPAQSRRAPGAPGSAGGVPQGLLDSILELSRRTPSETPAEGRALFDGAARSPAPAAAPDAAALGWARATTDPRRHDPRRFRYLVHAVHPDIASFHHDEGRWDSARFIDYSQNPAALSGAPAIWSSLVDQDHLATYSEAGFILDVPPGAIVTTADGYMSNFGRTLGAKEVQKAMADPKRPIESPEQVLARSERSGHDYNAVVLTGSDPSRPNAHVRPAGVFIKVDSEGDELADPALARNLRAAARRLKIPVILLPDEPEAGR